MLLRHESWKQMPTSMLRPHTTGNPIKRLLCDHEYEFVRNIYGDEIIHAGWNRSRWRCKKCGKWQARPYLFDEEVRDE